jgi:hypothetical protein
MTELALCSWLVLLSNFPVDDVGKYFKLSVWMGAEASSWGNAVFVQDTKATELFVIVSLITADGCQPCGREMKDKTYEAKEKVWKVLSQS